MNYTNIYDFFYRNNNTTPQNVVLKMPKDNMFKNNLLKKRVRLQKFYLNNSGVQLFHPERVTDSSYFSVTTDATTTYYSNNSLNPTSLKYYVVVRRQDGTKAGVAFLRQPNINNASVPNSVIYEDYQYYTNPYFKYFDFTHFLTLLINAFGAAQTLVLNSPETATFNYVFDMASDNTFTFGVPNYVDSTNPAYDPAYSTYYFELSESLIHLFPFKNTKTSYGTYRLNIPDTPYDVKVNPIIVPAGEINYYQITCPFYDTIYPFQQLLFQSDDLRVNPITFVGNNQLESNNAPDNFVNAILSYDIGTNLFNQTYNYYKYVNEYNSMYMNFVENESTENRITIQIFLRMKNNLLVPYILNPNELVSFSLELVYTDL